MKVLPILIATATIPIVSSFTVVQRLGTTSSTSTTTRRFDTIVSPFDSSSNRDDENNNNQQQAAVATLPNMSEKEPLDLTWDNVELVLDEMRPYLIQDGGNVAITDIDGPVVLLELQGACGTCPSSTVCPKIFLFFFLVWLLLGWPGCPVTHFTACRRSFHVLVHFSHNLHSQLFFSLANIENGFGTRIKRTYSGNSRSNSKYAPRTTLGR
jgi:hypothetical protein